MANVEKLSSSPSKSKVNSTRTGSGRTRYQLFDQVCKADLLKIFKKDLQPLVLEDEKGNRKDQQEEKDNSVSLDLEGSSSDEEDNVENLPKDSNENETEKAFVSPKKGLFCGSCDVTFMEIAEQRLHCTLDWHRYNVKRKLHGQGPVGETKFDEMIDDLSSIDGSDDEVEESTTGDNLNRLMDKLTTTTEQSEKQHRIVTSSQKQNVEKSPKVHFKNNDGQIITCYKTILFNEDKHNDNPTKEGPTSRNFNLATVLENSLKITIIMASGGHFAAAVFDGHACTLHKTFHSYTTRAKQGGSQGARDAKSGTQNCKSAGASLRRYNEQSFSQHIQDLLNSWKDHISNSDLVFYRAISSNANVLFSGKNPPLQRSSSNLRTVPFVTKRPTFSEVKRVHSLLTTIHVYESMEAFLSAHTHFKKTSSKSSPKSKVRKPINRAKSRSPKRKNSLELLQQQETHSGDENENADSEIEFVEQIVDFSELKEYDDSLNADEKKKKKNKKTKPESTFKPEGPIVELCNLISQEDSNPFQTLLKSVTESEAVFDINQPINVQGYTLLHSASQQNRLDILWSLLENGCDPAIKDKSGKYPYNCAESRECRDTFRRFMGEHPDKYDYKKAQVPPPLSEEMEKEKAEKKKLMNKLKREKEKQKKAEKYEKDKETEEQRRFLNLSDREKRAFAAEQRILANCKRNAEKAPVLIRCFECASDITGKVPFEYSQNVFCTTKCLAAHRKKFPAPLPV